MKVLLLSVGLIAVCASSIYVNRQHRRMTDELLEDYRECVELKREGDEIQREALDLVVDCADQLVVYEAAIRRICEPDAGGTP